MEETIQNLNVRNPSITVSSQPGPEVGLGNVNDTSGKQGRLKVNYPIRADTTG